MAFTQPEWVLRQLNPNFFSLILGDDETWVHFLPFTSRREQIDRSVYDFLAGMSLALPRKELSGQNSFTLPTQRLAVFHPALPGRAVDFMDPEDRKLGVRFLGRFHRATAGFRCEPRPHVTLGGLGAKWEKRLRRLNEFGRLARFRLNPGVMDEAFLKRHSQLNEQIKRGLQALRDASYAELCAEQGQLCYFHFCPGYFWRFQGEVLPWHFAFCHWDLPAVDLYRYVMQAARRDFSVRTVRRLLAEYESVRPLKPVERGIFRALFIFPERLYRLFAAFYLNRSNRAPRFQLRRIAEECAFSEERRKVVEALDSV